MKKTLKQVSAAFVLPFLVLCFLLSIGDTRAYAVAAEETMVITEENIEAAENATQELVPMRAPGCNNPTTLAGWMNVYSSKYGFTYNNTGLGHDIPLSNGYYYHAIAQTNNYVLFIYNSSGGMR